jgi:type I restriction enzyme S subunit
VNLPRGWTVATFAEVGRWRGGGTPSKSNPDFWLGGYIPWVSPKDMKSSFVNDSGDHITPSALTNSSTDLIEAGAVLIVTRSGILRHTLPVAMNTVPVAINQDLKAVNPFDGILAEFLRYLLVNFGDDILHECAKSGTTVDSLDFDRLKDRAIQLPPRAEQRRIVTKLDELTARLARARAELDRTILLASNLRAAVLRSYFSGEATQNWPRVMIEEILTEGLIGLVRSKEEQQSTGTPYVRMNHYDLEGRWNVDKLTYVSCTKDEIQRFSLRQGDVLFNTRNSVELVGKVAIWPGGNESFVYNNNLLRMRFREGVFAEFLGRYMMSPPFKEALAQHKSATTSVAAIYQRSLYKLLVPLPSLEQQRDIVLRIEAASARADRLEAEGVRVRVLLDRLESAILARAFKGELVLQDPNDEPASALLDRILAQRASAPKVRQKPRNGSRATA